MKSTPPSNAAAHAAVAVRREQRFTLGYRSGGGSPRGPFERGRERFVELHGFF
jgi:hypothetical protein